MERESMDPLPPTAEMPPSERQGYLLPYHWFMPRDDILVAYHDVYVERVVDLVVESGARRVLEVGCGDGWNCAQLVKRGLDVCGIDWSAHGIEHARRLVPEARFFRGDVTDPSFRSSFPDPFDAAALVEVIEHIPPGECARTLRNIRQCLRTGGRLVLTTPSARVPNTNRRHYRHFTPATIEDVVKEAGRLRLVRMEGYGDVVHLRWFRRLRRLVDNRIFLVRPLRRALLGFCRDHARGTPLERCYGIVAVAEAID